MSQTDAQYVTEKLFERLPDNEGRPLLAMDDRDITIVNQAAFFEAVAIRAEGKDQEQLPGFEPDPETVKRNRQIGVAVARTGKGVMYLERVMTTTYNEDTCRSLFRFANSDGAKFIPVDPDDTPNSLYLRTTDNVEALFSAAQYERIPLSAHRREHGITELRKRFEDRDKKTVLDMSVLAGRNNARMRDLWVKQLVDATKGTYTLPLPARQAFDQYAITRPIEYMQSPDVIKVVANAISNRRQRSGVA